MTPPTAYENFNRRRRASWERPARWCGCVSQFPCYRANGLQVRKGRALRQGNPMLARALQDEWEEHRAKGWHGAGYRWQGSSPSWAHPLARRRRRFAPRRRDRTTILPFYGRI